MAQAADSKSLNVLSDFWENPFRTSQSELRNTDRKDQ